MPNLLYSETFINQLKKKIDPKVEFDKLIELKLINEDKNFYSINLPNSQEGDLLNDLIQGLNEFAGFYNDMIKAYKRGLQALSSPDWMLNKVNDHIELLTLYKNYLIELNEQSERQKLFALKTAEASTAEGTVEQANNNA